MMMTLYTKEGFWDAGAVDGFPWLFVGSLSAAETQSRLQEANVTRLLTVARDLPVSPKTYNIIQKNNILQVDLDDHPHANLLQVAEACCEFIDQAELDATTTTTTTAYASGDDDDDDNNAPLIPSILVHCASGASRSVSIIIAWLMTRKDYTLDQALSAIRQTRSLANPNDGFLQQLKFLEHHEMTTTMTTTTQNNDDDDQSLLSTIMATTRIAAANRRYEDSIRGEKEERNQLQIRLANDVHRDVDDLEVKIQRFRSVMTRTENNDDYNTNNNNPQSFLLTNNDNNNNNHTTITKTSLLREATFLSDRLDGIASNSTGGNNNNNNNNSKVILKAARNKLERLIETLEMTLTTTTTTTTTENSRH